MVTSDATAVHRVESAATQFPWSLSQFNQSIDSNDDSDVLVVDNTVAGFTIFQRVLDESSLLNIAVAPKFQGKGYGRLLLQTDII